MILAQIKYFVDKKYTYSNNIMALNIFIWYFKKTSKLKYDKERFYNI